MNNEITVTVVLNPTTAINMRGDEKELIGKIRQIGKGLYLTNKDSRDDDSDNCKDVMVISSDNMLNTAVISLSDIMSDECSNLI
jgi:hypothetical protein